MITNSELIGKYFDKSLTGEEKVLFKQKYETEPEFKQAVTEQAQIIVALKASGLEKEILDTKPVVALPKKTGLYLSMSVAAAAILSLVIVTWVFNQKINDREQQIAELQKVKPVTIISSNDSAQKILKEYEQKIAQLQDALQEIAKTGTQTPNMQTTNVTTEKNRAKLFAINTLQDEQTKGTGEILRFTAPDRKVPANADNVVICWTSVEKTGNINLYLINDRNDKILVEKLSTDKYELKQGEYPLSNLERNSLYIFEIQIGKKVYSFPFDTK